jgi:hypothetical protein
MMRGVLKGLVHCAVIAILAACASTAPPIRYIQLSDEGVPLGTASSPIVMVDAVAVPDFLLRNELLMRIDQHRLSYNTGVRWAEPLDIGVQRVLATRLSAALDSFAVFSFPSGRSGRDLDWRVDVTLRNFEATGSDVVLRADVQLHPRDGQEILTEPFEARARLASSDPAVVAAGLSALLGRLANDIATRIKSINSATAEIDAPP